MPVSHSAHRHLLVQSLHLQIWRHYIQVLFYFHCSHGAADVDQAHFGRKDIHPLG